MVYLFCRLITKGRRATTRRQQWAGGSSGSWPSLRWSWRWCGTSFPAWAVRTATTSTCSTAAYGGSREEQQELQERLHRTRPCKRHCRCPPTPNLTSSRAQKRRAGPPRSLSAGRKSPRKCHAWHPTRKSRNQVRISIFVFMRGGVGQISWTGHGSSGAPYAFHTHHIEDDFGIFCQKSSSKFYTAHLE